MHLPPFLQDDLQSHKAYSQADAAGRLLTTLAKGAGGRSGSDLFLTKMANKTNIKKKAQCYQTQKLSTLHTKTFN